MRAFKLFLVLLISCLTPAALAQGDCPAIIATALEAVNSACNQTARNQLCYGHITAHITPREGISDLQFEQSGDVAGIADIESLQLSSFSGTDGEWGVVLAKVQANLPDTLPGQNVTFLLFGDVSITDVSNQKVELPVTATSGVNVRQLPTTNASVMASLQNGQEVIATGRLPDNSWIRVRVDDTSAGWVSAHFLEGDLYRLPPSTPGGPAFGPMQAFYFTTGFGDASCEEAPESGILVQTPEGAGLIELRANNVDIQLGSTVYLQAVPGDAMYVNVIEGHATLTAYGETQVVPAGTIGTVPLDSNGLASGPPEYPETYNHTALQTLPVDTTLPEAVTVEEGIAEDDIPAAIDIANGLPPNGGRWIHTETITHPGCPPPGQPAPAVGSVGRNYPVITFNEDRSIMELPVPNTVTMSRTGEFSYAGRYSIALWEVTFTSPTTYTGTWYNGRVGDECTLTASITGVYQP